MSDLTRVGRGLVVFRCLLVGVQRWGLCVLQTSPATVGCLLTKPLEPLDHLKAQNCSLGNPLCSLAHLFLAVLGCFLSLDTLGSGLWEQG